MDQARHDRAYAGMVSFAWILVIAGSSLAFSRAFACATPFAALGAVAALRLDRRDALLAVLTAWLGNQVIGFLLLGYPHTWQTFGWGGAISVAAFAAAATAMMVSSLPTRSPARDFVAFTAAFVAYEAVLFAATSVLPSGGNAFALLVVARIFAINAVAFAGLLLLHQIVIRLGLIPPAPGARPAAA